MAKFCTRCGRRLEEGEICNCMNQTAEEFSVQEGNSQPGNPAPESQNHYLNNERDNEFQGNYNRNASQEGYYQNSSQMGEGPQGGYYQNSSQMGGGPQGGYYQNGPQMGGQPQGGYYQNGPQSGYYQNHSQAQWFGNKTEKFVNGTQNMFSQMLPLLGKPSSQIKKLSETRCTAVGYELIIFHAVAAAVISGISLAAIGSKLGGYIDMPYFQVILSTLLLVLGMDFLEAGLMKATVTVAGGRASFGDMVLVMGQKALIGVITSVLSVIFMGFAPVLSLLVVLLGGLAGSIYQIFAYYTVAGLETDKVIFSYIVEKILVVVVAFAVIFVLYLSLLQTVIDMMSHSIFSGFYF